MSGVNTAIIGLLLGIALGLCMGAAAQNQLDARTVTRGYFVHKDRAYQLVPAPNPNRSE